MWLFCNILYLITYSWNATLLTFHFSGARQRLFVPEQLPKELKPTHHVCRRPSTYSQIIYRRSTDFGRGAPPLMFHRILIVTLSNNFLQLEIGLRRSFQPLLLLILDSPCLLIVLIYTKHKDIQMKSWPDLTLFFP